MSDPIQNLLGLGALKTNPFPQNSRYYSIPTSTLETADGKVVAYLQRRFIPNADRFALLHEYTVTQGERPDTLAAKLIGDPELFWQLCDSNSVMQPDELSDTPGRVVRVTLPEGIPGVSS